MMAIRSACIVAALAIVAAGCFPENEPVAPYDRGPVKTATVEMGPAYGVQVFYDLGTSSVVRVSPITAWDLALECSDASHHVTLNSSLAMSAVDLGPVDFAVVPDRDHPGFRYDTPDGSSDSTAIGRWWTGSGNAVASRNHLYMIDRGVDERGRSRGFVKMRIEGYERGVYTIRFANLDGSNETLIDVPVDDACNVVGLSLDDGGIVVKPEPPKASWDLVFTRYTHLFYEPELTPYAVTGALINRSATEVAVDSLTPFVDVTAARVGAERFSSRRDVIGYDWKSFDLNTNEYTVKTGVTYIVRDAEGFSYKLHFIDFYNQDGVKGYPTFEFSLL